MSDNHKTTTQCKVAMAVTCLLIFIFMNHFPTPVFAHQQKRNEISRGAIRDSLNKYNQFASLFVCTKWFSKSFKSEDSKLRETEERVLLRKLLRLSDVEFSELDAAFSEATAKSNEIASILTNEYRKQLDFETGLTENRIDPEIPPSAYLTQKDIDKKLDLMKAELFHVEEKLAKRIDEILDPNQKSILFQRWVRVESIHLPFSASYLELTDEQKEILKESVNTHIEARKEIERLPRKSNKSEDINNHIMENPKYWETRFAIFANLNAVQFREAAVVLFSPSINTRNLFESRIAAIERGLLPGEEAFGQVFLDAERAILFDYYKSHSKDVSKTPSK